MKKSTAFFNRVSANLSNRKSFPITTSGKKTALSRARYGPPPGDAYDPRRGQVDPQAYGPPPGAPPQAGQQAGQYGGQESTEWADQNTEEWVEVIVSGAEMRATAGDDAPMLFAGPYGRNCKVVT